MEGDGTETIRTFGNRMNDGTQIAAIPRDPFEEFLSNPVAVRTFMFHLNVLMEGFEFPSEWEGKVDRYIAMMLSRKQDPMYAQLDFDSMMQLYSKMLMHNELCRQQMLQQQQMQQHIGQFLNEQSQYGQESLFRKPNPPVVSQTASCPSNPSYNDLNVSLPKTPVPLDTLRKTTDRRKKQTIDGGSLQQKVPTISTVQSNDDVEGGDFRNVRTYAELQPVESSTISKSADGKVGAVSATEVLKRHHETNLENEKTNNTESDKQETNKKITRDKNSTQTQIPHKNSSDSEKGSISNTDSRSIPSTSTNNKESENVANGQIPSLDANATHEQNERAIIKQEILMPPSVESNVTNSPRTISNNTRTPQSVNLTSVHPNPCRSVAEVPGNLPLACVNGTGSYEGKGDLVVSYTFGNCCCGPIYVSTEKEVRAIVDLVAEKYSEKEAKARLRQLTGISSHENDTAAQNIKAQAGQFKGFYSSGSVRARSILSPEIVVYIDRSFTQRGMKENVVGRKKKNYPKRSKILKVCPKTGELIYPPGHPHHKDQQKKNEDLLLPKNIKKELDEDAMSGTIDDNSNEIELEKAVFGKDIQKINSVEASPLKASSRISGNTNAVKHSEDKSRKSSTRNAVEEEDSEADIELDCYNPSTPMMQENINRIIFNTQNVISSSHGSSANKGRHHEDDNNQVELLLTDTSNVELRPNLGPPSPKTLNTIDENIHEDALTSCSKIHKQNKIEGKLIIGGEKHSSNKEPTNDNESKVEFHPHKSSSNIKVSLDLFSSKKKRKEIKTRKRKLKPPEQSNIDVSDGEDSDMKTDDSSEEGNDKGKSCQPVSKQCDPLDDDLNLSASKLAQTKTTYVRSKRPFISTPSSSIHSPAPYRTPSYSPVSYSLPSPLSPFPQSQTTVKKIAEDHQIDVR